MSELKAGDAVDFDDPLGYSGSGTVLEVQTKPHLAVLIDVTAGTASGKQTWVLTPHVRPSGVPPLACEWGRGVTAHHSDDRIEIASGGIRLLACGFHTTYYIAEIWQHHHERSKA